MGVVIRAGKPLGLVDHKNGWLDEFCLNSFLTHFYNIAFRIYPFTQFGQLSIYGNLAVFNQLFPCPSRADSRIGKKLLKLGMRRCGLGGLVCVLGHVQNLMLPNYYESIIYRKQSITGMGT